MSVAPYWQDQPNKVAPLPPAASLGVSINVRGLSKSFGARGVLTGLDLDVPAGEFLAIVGRSGCGKSTLLRLLTGLEVADCGSIRLTPSGAAARIMFQESRLLPWAKVAANVAVGLGPGASDARNRSLEALRAVGLEDRADVWPSTLSGGQKQRVALARALVSRPRLLALDEPLGALDALTRIEMQQLITDVVARERFTSILVTHDVAEAVALADRVLVLDQGLITLDVRVPLAKKGRRGSREAAEIEAHILATILGRSQTMPDIHPK